MSEATYMYKECGLDYPCVSRVVFRPNIMPGAPDLCLYDSSKNPDWKEI